MKYRRLGNSGLKLSELSYGSWVTFGNQIDVNLASELIKTAYDAGVNFFDNAEAYAAGESEKIMGDALYKLKFPRDTWCVSSKVFWGGDLPTQIGLSAKHIHDCCNKALKRLKVDYLDLYFCHRPDPDTPIEETVRAMDNLIKQGKILYWGTSEWSADQIEQAFKIANKNYLTPPTMEQPQYNLLNRDRFENEYKPIFEKYSMGTTIWSPLCSGILTGKYKNGIPKDARFSIESYKWLWEKFKEDGIEKEFTKIEKFCELANELKLTPAQLAIKWCLNNSNVSTVILGASKVEQLKQNLDSINLINHNIDFKKIEKLFE